MSIKIVPLDFMGQGALLQPRSQKLHDMAIEFCKRELKDGDKINLAYFRKVFVVGDFSDQREGLLVPEEVTGIGCTMLKHDIPIFRTINSASTAKLHQRFHNYFADDNIIGPMLGQEILIHLSNKETPEQRCSNWEQELKAAKAEPADRYSIIVSPK